MRLSKLAAPAFNLLFLDKVARPNRGSYSYGGDVHPQRDVSLENYFGSLYLLDVYSTLTVKMTTRSPTAWTGFLLHGIEKSIPYMNT
jgi:hypothetical protein